MSMGWSYYLLTVVENLDCLLEVILMVGSFASALYFIISFCMVDTDFRFSPEEKGRKWKALWSQAKKIFFTLVFLGLICTLLPSKKDMLIIAGLAYAEDSQALHEIGGTAKKALDLINKKLEEEIGKDE
jgi:hypothetical protein